MKRNNKSFYEKKIKRPLDLIISFVGIIVLSPIFIIVALLIKFKFGSPILFKQERPGKDEKIFSMFKFRTMTNEKNEYGILLPDEVRLTRFGRVLRATSLDELPSLFNILKGDMSIVGPRPLLIRYLPYYKEKEKIRHSIRPGLTGLAQVSGRNFLEWDKRLELDVIYSQNITFKKDVHIMFLTLKKVVKREDVVSGNQHILKSLDVERGASENECNKII